MSAVLTVAVPLLAAVLLGTWAAWQYAHAAAVAEIRATGPRPSYRRVLAEVRKERARTGVPASFEEAA